MKTSPKLPMRSIGLVLAFFLGVEAAAFANSSPPQGCPGGFTPTTAKKDPDTCPLNGTDATCAIDPVLLTGGKLFMPYTDVQIPGLGRHNENHLKLYRCYSSRDGFEGAFGHGWVSSLDLSPYLTVTVTGTPPIVRAGSSVSFRDQDGSLLNFRIKQDVPLSQTPIVFHDGQRRLEWTPGTNWQTNGVFRYVKPHGTVFRVDMVNSVIRVHSITDRNGNKISYGYDGSGRIDKLTDDSGRSLLVTYGTNGKVSQLKDPLGRTWSYAYDNLKNLVQVTDPLNRKEVYAYADSLDPHNITSITDASGYKTSYVYNAQDQVKQQTKPDGSIVQFTFNDFLGTSTMIDEFGGTWRFEYHKIGLGTLVVAPDGTFNEYAYDPQENLMTSHRDALGHVTEYAYDLNNNVTEIRNAAGDATQYEFDPAFNFMTKTTDPLGHVSTREYDSAGNLVKTTTALGHSTTMTYDSHGQMTSRTDARGNATMFVYDVLGNLLRRTDALGNSTTYAHDLAGRLESVTDANGRQTRYAYDAGNRLLQVQFADGSVVKTVYDANNRAIERIDANGNSTQFVYGVPTSDGGEPGCGPCGDSGNNASASPNKIIDPLGNTTQFTYDAHGNRLSIVDADGNVTTYAYDAQDRMTSSTDALGGVTRLEYDAVGNLLRVIDAKGQATLFAYDALNRRVSETDALGNATSFAYDAAGNLVSRADANGKTTSYQYDAVNRLVKILYPDSRTIRFDYDPSGNTTQMIDPTGSTSYVYDKLNRVSQSSAAGQAIQYAYDAIGNVISVTSSAGTTAYAYDTMYRMSSVTSPQNLVTGYSYDAAGRRTQTAYPNGIKALYTYDKADWLLSLSHVAGNPAVVLPGSVYTYDAVGNRLTLRDNEGTHTYVYDKLHRLKSVTYPLGNKNEYVYDPVGNRLSLKEGAQITNYSYDAANRLLSAGTKSFVYDANGNLISQTDHDSGFTFGYDYDFENRLAQVSREKTEKKKPKEKEIARYSYDGLGRRVERVTKDETTRFVYTGFDVLYETNAKNKPTLSYTHGARIDEILSATQKDGDTFVYLADGLGSTTALANKKGKITATYSYDVFGDLRSKPDAKWNNYLFTGRELDSDADLYYYRNRWYLPSQGRFIRKDPSGLNGGINLYLYASANPVNFIDSLGTKPKKPIEVRRDCDAAEMAQCIAQCEDRGVQSCMVTELIIDTVVDGVVVPLVKTSSLSCSCNDKDDNPCAKGVGGPIPPPKPIVIF